MTARDGREQRMKLTGWFGLTLPLWLLLIGGVSTASDGPPMPPQEEDRTGAVDLRGLPDNVQSSQAQFEFLKRCATYRRFKTLFEQGRDDPRHVLNNAVALAAMSPMERKMLEARRALVESGGVGCDRWTAEVSVADASWQIYNATLAEALAGSGDAAFCFVATSWNPLDTPGSVYPFLRRNYARYAREFIDREIANGSWPMVSAAYNASRAQHGVQTAVRRSQDSLYVWSRLMELGAYDPVYRSSYAQEAAEHGVGLPLTVFAEADAKATALFRDAFGARQMTEDDFYENCGN